MAFISSSTRVAEHRTRLVCLGETPSPRVRCRLAMFTYLLTYTVRTDERQLAIFATSLPALRSAYMYATGRPVSLSLTRVTPGFCGYRAGPADGSVLAPAHGPWIIGRDTRNKWFRARAGFPVSGPPRAATSAIGS